jgi:hypothetical protein
MIRGGNHVAERDPGGTAVRGIARLSPRRSRHPFGGADLAGAQSVAGDDSMAYVMVKYVISASRLWSVKHDHEQTNQSSHLPSYYVHSIIYYLFIIYMDAILFLNAPPLAS